MDPFLLMWGVDGTLVRTDPADGDAVSRDLAGTDGVVGLLIGTRASSASASAALPV